MILTIDIGNTSITLGGFETDEPSFVARLATDPTKTEDEYASMIVNILNLSRYYYLHLKEVLKIQLIFHKNKWKILINSKLSLAKLIVILYWII